MISDMDQKNLSLWLESIIKDFVTTSPHNNLPSGDKIWKNPLVGFCRGSDPLFSEFKSHIGNFYWTPSDVIQNSFPHLATDIQELCVISWILPQTEAVKNENAKQELYPSLLWAQAYVLGERLNNLLRLYVVETLQKQGVPAVAPMLSPQFRQEVSQDYGRASTWSERHTAFAAGLGTFGLCDGLITPAGKAMRAGSVVAKLSVAPTPRPYTDPHAYCLFYNSGDCLECMRRCPVGAISPTGHHKGKCARHVNETAAEYAKKNYHLDKAHCCGLCQTKVPCSSQIPATLGTADR